MTGAVLMKICLAYKRKLVLSSSLKTNHKGHEGTPRIDIKGTLNLQSAVSVCPSLSAILQCWQFWQFSLCSFVSFVVKHLAIVLKALCNQPAQGLPFSRDLPRTYCFHGQNHRSPACFLVRCWRASRTNRRSPVAGRDQQDQSH